MGANSKLIFYIIDGRSNWYYLYNIELPQFKGYHNGYYPVGEFEDLKNMCAALNAWIPQGEKIHLLYLVGHGDAGMLQLGFPGLFASTADDLKGLRRYLTPGSQVLIHGCGVASDRSIIGKGGTPECPKPIPGVYKGGTKGEGYVFLRAIARATGVPVTGAINAQYGDKYFRYEGATVTVYPGGAQKKGMGTG